MLHGILALTVRSLRSDERSVRMHLVRMAIAVLSFVMVSQAWSISFVMGAPGLYMFNHICHLNFFAIILAGTSYFATAISEEKEDMTLGLLKMAGVGPVAILLGKSIPRLAFAGMLLTLQLPFTMLAITLGGVSLGQVLAAYVALLAFLFAVSQFGLFVSTICTQTSRASTLASIAFVAYFFGPYLAMGLTENFVSLGYLASGGMVQQSLRASTGWLISTSVFQGLHSILATGFSASPIRWQAVSNIIAGLVFFGLAWLAFEPFSRNEKPASPPRGLLSMRIGGRGLLGAGRAWNSMALIWHAFNYSCGGKSLVIAKFIVYGALIGVVVWTAMLGPRSQFRLAEIGAMVLSTMIVALAIETVVHASRLLYTEIKWRTLSSLVILPVSAGRIVLSKVLASLGALIPALSYLLVGFMCVATDRMAVQHMRHSIFDAMVEPAFWYMISQYILLLHGIVIGSLYVKWGAAPLAFVVIYFANFLAALLFLRTRSSNFVFLLGVFVTIAASFYLQSAIVKRIRVLAARE
jgi:hypothetical protein